MNKKARAALGLLLLSSALVSCSLNSETELYTIEFYTDYEGISSGKPGDNYLASELDKTKATLVGKGYVAVNGTNKKARLTSLQKDEEGNVIEFQTPRQKLDEAYSYSWDSWQGFYEDGNAVNLSEITGNCAVFAHFSVEIKTFSVTIQNADSSPVFETKANYGDDLGTLLKSHYETDDADAAKKALSEELTYPYVASYYQEYHFSGKFKDGDGNEKTLDELFALDPIKADLKLTAVYGDPINKSYTVSLYEDSSLSGTPTPLTLTYDDPIPAAASPDGFDANFKHYTFDSWKGTYGTGEDVPESLRGKPVDVSHIRYDCSLYPTFKETPFSYKVTFHNTGATEDPEIEATHGSLFGSLSAPTVTVSDSNKVFTGHWSTSEDGTKTSDWVSTETPITEDLSLYPVIVSKTITAKGGKDDDFTFEFSSDQDGYLLTGFAVSSTRGASDTELTSNDFPSSSSLSPFSFVGITKFGSDSSPTTKATFPSSVSYVAGNAFRGCNKLQTLSLPGLVKAEAFAFSQLYALSSFIFPSTIKSVGSRAFYNCSNLSEVKIDLTEEKAAEVLFSDGWDDKGQGSKVTLAYAS